MSEKRNNIRSIKPEKIYMPEQKLDNTITNIIYKVTFPNNKVYIGKTCKTLYKRIQSHIQDYNKGIIRAFYNAIMSYGINNLNFEIIDQDKDNNNLSIKEKYWIDYYNSNNIKFGYNLTKGGEGTLGRKISQKTKNKISISNSNYHKTHNITLSDETKKKISESKKNYYSDNENRLKDSIAQGAKPFLVFTKDDNVFIGEWISRKECARDLNIMHNKIGQCINGKLKQHKGYIFIDKDQYYKQTTNKLII